ncbi:MAG: VWA domain-containing protein [Minicystis sp.]
MLSRKIAPPSLIVRLLAVGAVLAAPLVPPAHREGQGRAVMIVADRSESVGQEGRIAAERFIREVWEHRGSAKVGVVAFDGVAEIRRPVDLASAPEAEADDPAPEITPRLSRGTDLAAAVRLAAAALPDSGERRLVLVTDGRATRGDALAEVRRAREAGIEVDTVPIGGSPSLSPMVARVTAREPRLADGEPAAMVAEVRGEASSSVSVTWRRDGQKLKSVRVQLDAEGKGTTVLDDPHPDAGTHVYDARVDGYDEAPAPRNAAAIDVSGKPRALIVSVDGECPGVLCDALDKAEVARTIVPLGDKALDPASLSGADLVVLADVPLAPAGGASEMGLGPRAQEDLIAFAQKGGGVLVTGGAFGFAPEYADAPIARMLPVEVENQGQIEDPRVAMAIMLDRSGSMGAMVGTHTKLQLAVEASLAAAITLRPDDTVALGSVDTKTLWNYPLGSSTGLAARREQIRSVDLGGGGIYVYTALVDAYAVLRGANAPLKHVILFADTADAEQQTEDCTYGACGNSDKTAETLAETARRAGITTSVVGIGRERDSDTPFLRRLAASGGGRFYITGNAVDLRRIFVSEARVATRSNLRAGPVSVDVAADHPVLAGVDVSRFPPLGGFVEARRRATAETALITREDQKPILASWRYGLGKVVALTTDLRADWKAGWSTFPEAGQVLRQAVRFALRRRGASASDVRVAVGERGAEINVELADDAEGTAAPASLEVYAFAASGDPKPIPAALERVAPGRFVARVATTGQPFVVARVRDAAGGHVGEAIGQIDAADEMAALGPDERALRALAAEGDGRFDPDARDALRTAGTRGREPVPLWPFFLLASAVLTCIDLWLRRLVRPRAAALVPVGPAVRRPPRAEPEKLAEAA